MKKIVIFGGGTGLSQILKGLKLFPIDVTAVVSVSDNGTSTGLLRKDYNIPAVGDITKVLLSMADIDDDLRELLNYRFTEATSLKAHSIKNLLLTALLDTKGDFANAIPILSKLLNIKGKVLPLTEDNIDLVGETTDGKTIKGEAEITACGEKIKRVRYDSEVNVNMEVIEALKTADLIVFSAGSILTSIVPHLLDKELNEAIKNSRAKKMYLCNLFTQPGETDNFTVSDHVKLIEEYLGEGVLDVVVANSAIMTNVLAKEYNVLEQKDPVVLDREELKKLNIEIVCDKLYVIENNHYRHDSLKTAYLIFKYVMDGNKNDFYN